MEGYALLVDMMYGLLLGTVTRLKPTVNRVLITPPSVPTTTCVACVLCVCPQVGCSEIVSRVVEDLKDEAEPYR